MRGAHRFRRRAAHWTLAAALVGVFALSGCGDSAPQPTCRCVGDVPEGHLDIACGATSCLGGTGYRCTDVNAAMVDPTICASCTDGTACTPSAPCTVGQVSCASGSAVCMTTGNAADGTACMGGVCNGGSCVACQDGAPCAPSNPCEMGNMVCSGGAPQCVATGNKPLGTSCGTNKYCANGAVCASCVQGASCTPANQPCSGGTIACANGTSTCVAGSALPDGTACGTNEVCYGGACTSCIAGGGCSLGSGSCHTGVLDCSMGPQCKDSGNPVTDGTPCGFNQVCSAGSCVSCSAAPALCGCTPESESAFCTRLAATCGAVTALDNCGTSRTVASCGTCTSPQTCAGGGTANVCGCTSETNAAFCTRLGTNCGAVTALDNCGMSRTVASCGTCTTPRTCGGGGTTNVCGCTAETDVAFCARLGKSCGTVTAADNCGVARTVSSCGICAATQICSANVCSGDYEPSDPICSVDGLWCWDNPLPQGNTLRAAFTSPSGTDWVVGAAGTVLHWDGTRWRGTMALANAQLNGVWGTTDNDVWVVGAKGTILHWNGTSWSAVASTVTVDLFAVWGSSTSDVWAAGQSGTLLHWNGSAWSKTTLTTTATLSAVWGVSSADVWVAGNGVFLHWNGSSWSSMTTTLSPTSLWGSSSTDIWAASPSGVARWDGVSWTTTWSAGGQAVRGSSSTNVWVVSSASGAAYHFDGISWTKVVPTIGRGETLYGLTASAGSTMLAVGQNGAMFRLLNGVWWELRQGVLQGLAANTGALGLYQLTAADATNVFAVGYFDQGICCGWGFTHGLVMRRTASGWSSTVLSTVVDSFSAVAASSSTDAWAADQSTQLAHFDGTAWSPVTLPSIVQGLVAISAADAWAVGNDKTYHWNGSAWTAVANPVSGTSVQLTTAAASGSQDVWAGSNNGTILHWNGSAWAAVPSGTTALFYRMSAPSPGAAFAATSGGVLSWNGSSWSNSGITQSASTVYATSASSAWAIVWNGSYWALQLWNGSAWTEQSPGIFSSIGPVDMHGAGGKVFVLGGNGEVLIH